MADASRVAVAILAIIGLSGVMGALVGYPVMWMWNYVCPKLFDLPRITFWQAFWLYVLAQTLFTRGTADKSE